MKGNRVLLNALVATVLVVVVVLVYIDMYIPWAVYHIASRATPYRVLRGAQTRFVGTDVCAQKVMYEATQVSVLLFFIRHVCISKEIFQYPRVVFFPPVLPISLTHTTSSSGKLSKFFRSTL